MSTGEPIWPLVVLFVLALLAGLDIWLGHPRIGERGMLAIFAGLAVVAVVLKWGVLQRRHRGRTLKGTHSDPKQHDRR